ncbi:DUF2023 family protein [Spirochaeta cellobiosiphila]|uniref:DUF2023 family protein n=1 Tax=Spirochaeta cellobiosiphila TaxID=504483 RepID=UPI00042576D2|nr:DUF2023 family protein [Spirochaeta cellobiosiphila]
MKILCHHIYELQKGLRNLVLHTIHKKELEKSIQKLENSHMAYVIQEVTPSRYNLFFGESECVELISQFIHKPLNEFTNEEDFILGTLLGYSRMEQCKRYLKRSTTKEEVCA